MSTPPTTPGTSSSSPRLPSSVAPAKENNHPSFLHHAWAPATAAFFIAALYLLRLDDVFYFLYGLESQGLLLARALADGHGFVDLSLPGHPAHVREPPLFYLSLAALIRLWGFKMLPLKVFIWASYVLSAALATALFQRRLSPLLALFASLLCFSHPLMFDFLTGPKSDLPFTVLVLASLLLLESTIRQLHSQPPERRLSLLPRAFATGILISATILTRSLGLALIPGAAAAFIPLGRKLPLRQLLLLLAAVCLPPLLAYSGWSLRNTLQAQPAGYTYLDWFRMDLEPDTPFMTAVDFHAPLLPEIPPAPLSRLLFRTGRHTVLYLANLGRSVLDLQPLIEHGEDLSFLLVHLLWLLFALFGIAGLIKTEKSQPGFPLVPVFLSVYFLACAAWPMDDLRLLLPLMPFSTLYILAGMGMLRGLQKKDPARTKSSAPRLNLILLALFTLTVFSLNVRSDWKKQRFFNRLPTVPLQPGFRVRFTTREAYDSYRLLLWTRENAEPGAVLMYHSPPPCRLISEHECVSIPFPEGGETALEKVRDFLVRGGTDYVVVDEWGRVFPGGAGWFTESILRPVVERFPDDFESVWQLPGRQAFILRVKRR